MCSTSDLCGFSMYLNSCNILVGETRNTGTDVYTDYNALYTASELNIM